MSPTRPSEHRYIGTPTIPPDMTIPEYRAQRVRDQALGGVYVIALAGIDTALWLSNILRALA